MGFRVMWESAGRGTSRGREGKAYGSKRYGVQKKPGDALDRGSAIGQKKNVTIVAEAGTGLVCSRVTRHLQLQRRQRQTISQTCARLLQFLTGARMTGAATGYCGMAAEDAAAAAAAAAKCVRRARETATCE